MLSFELARTCRTVTVTGGSNALDLPAFNSQVLGLQVYPTMPDCDRFFLELAYAVGNRKQLGRDGPFVQAASWASSRLFVQRWPPLLSLEM